MLSICSRSCQSANTVFCIILLGCKFRSKMRRGHCRAGSYIVSHLWLNIELQATVEINRKTNFKLREPEETRAHVGAKHGTPYHSGVGLVLEAPSMSSCNSNELTNNIAISLYILL